MSGGRVYPDDPAGPFPEPPQSFEDREGRSMTLRGVEPGEDVPEGLVAMYEAFDAADRAQGIPPSGEDRIRRWLEELYADGLNVVARHDEEVAGHATLVPDEHSWELAIFVHQDYQGAGIGKRLINALLGFGAAHGVERVWLSVERWNRAAIGLYEDVGFEMSGDRTFEREMSLRLA